MNQFLSRLSSVWQPKKGGRLEIKGQSYKFEDFNFKVGVVSQAALTIGISLEVLESFYETFYINKFCFEKFFNHFFLSLKTKLKFMVVVKLNFFRLNMFHVLFLRNVGE